MKTALEYMYRNFIRKKQQAEKYLFKSVGGK
jgi:hypothetical protein